MRARLSHTPFDYLVCLYRMSLAEYFMRPLELKMHSKGIVSGLNAVQEAKLQHHVHQL